MSRRRIDHKPSLQTEESSATENQPKPVVEFRKVDLGIDLERSKAAASGKPKARCEKFDFSEYKNVNGQFQKTIVVSVHPQNNRKRKREEVQQNDSAATQSEQVIDSSRFFRVSKMAKITVSFIKKLSIDELRTIDSRIVIVNSPWREMITQIMQLSSYFYPFYSESSVLN